VSTSTRLLTRCTRAHEACDRDALSQRQITVWGGPHESAESEEDDGQREGDPRFRHSTGRIMVRFECGTLKEGASCSSLYSTGSRVRDAAAAGF
jgi:hypothetical protein